MSKVEERPQPSSNRNRNRNRNKHKNEAPHKAPSFSKEAMLAVAAIQQQDQQEFDFEQQQLVHDDEEKKQKEHGSLNDAEAKRMEGERDSLRKQLDAAVAAIQQQDQQEFDFEQKQVVHDDEEKNQKEDGSLSSTNSTRPLPCMAEVQGKEAMHKTRLQLAEAKRTEGERDSLRKQLDAAKLEIECLTSAKNELLDAVTQQNEELAKRATENPSERVAQPKTTPTATAAIQTASTIKAAASTTTPALCNGAELSTLLSTLLDAKETALAAKEARIKELEEENRVLRGKQHDKQTTDCQVEETKRASALADENRRLTKAVNAHRADIVRLTFGGRSDYDNVNFSMNAAMKELAQIVARDNQQQQRSPSSGRAAGNSTIQDSNGHRHQQQQHQHHNNHSDSDHDREACLWCSGKINLSAGGTFGYQVASKQVKRRPSPNMRSSSPDSVFSRMAVPPPATSGPPVSTQTAKAKVASSGQITLAHSAAQDSERATRSRRTHAPFASASNVLHRPLTTYQQILLDNDRRRSAERN